MKKVYVKLLVSFIALLLIIGVTSPVFGANETKLYRFYNVQNGENLDGKSFLILSSFVGQPAPRIDGNAGITGFPVGANPVTFVNGKIDTKGAIGGNIVFSPILETYGSTNGEYDYINGVDAPKIQSNLCIGTAVNEWTFEKNQDGTYSLYYMFPGKSTETKNYLMATGNSVSLTTSIEGKGKFEVEYKAGGKIALKLVDYIADRGPVMIDENYQYVVFSPDGYMFKSGSANDNNVLELYKENTDALVSYNYIGNIDDYLDYYNSIGNEPQMNEYIQTVGTTESPLLRVGNASNNGTYYLYSESDLDYLSDLFEKKTEDMESFKDPAQKSSKIWGTEVQLVGWTAETIRDDFVVIPLDATLKLDASTGTIKTKDVNGTEVALRPMTTLWALYSKRSENIFFNIKYTNDIDLNDGSLITENVNTESLAVGHVYYPMPTVEDFNSFISDSIKGGRKGPTDNPLEYVNKLLVKTYNPSSNEVQIVIEGFMEIDPVTNERISYTPATGKSISDIVDYIMEYINKYSDELDVQDIDNINDYDVVWYDQEHQPSGIMIRGIMRDMKNFLVIDAKFEDIPENEIPIDEFKIEILNDDGDVLKTLRLDDPNVEVSADRKTYTWKLNDMTEDTYTVKQYNRNSGNYIPSTNASSDVDTALGDVTEDSTQDVVTLRVSTVNNRKDRVSLVNKYTAPSNDNSNNNNNNNSGTQPSGGSNPAGGGAAPAPAGGPVQQVIHNVYNGLLPKTGSAGSFIITTLGIIMVVLAIRLRNKKDKRRKKTR